MPNPKLQVTFELDTTGTSFAIKHKGDEVTAVLQNLSSMLQTLKCHFLERNLDTLTDKTLTPEMRDALLEHYEEEIKLADQIFNNYRVVGTMEDGKEFVFTHQEPGYRETMEFK